MSLERGFTLVELMVALVVLTVGLLALVTTAALVTRMIALPISNASLFLVISG